MTDHRPHRRVDFRSCIDDALRHAVAIGAVLVLLVPAARGHHALLGWLPLWLLGMPLVALAALRLVAAARDGDANASVPARHRLRPRRVTPQAVRRALPAGTVRQARAA